MARATRQYKPVIFTFSYRSLLNDTDQARAESWREFEAIARQAALYFTDAKVYGLVRKIAKHGRPGRKPEARINALILEEYDAAVREAAPQRVKKAELGRAIYEKYHLQYDLQSPKAVTKQLDRLLNRRDSFPQGQN